jgi:hypothetical protein
VPGQEGHPAAGHLADQHRLARLTERRVYPHLLGVGQELVEARPADDPDVRHGDHGGQATFSPEEPEEEEEEDDEPPDFDDESDFDFDSPSDFDDEDEDESPSDFEDEDESPSDFEDEESEEESDEDAPLPPAATGPLRLSVR